MQGREGCLCIDASLGRSPKPDEGAAQFWKQEIEVALESFRDPPLPTLDKEQPECKRDYSLDWLCVSSVWFGRAWTVLGIVMAAYERAACSALKRRRKYTR